jgi:phosphotriesterase-related protein
MANLESPVTTVQTVTGPVDADELGRTLVHEHIRISWPGEELDNTYSWDRADTVARAVDKMAELIDAGFRTFVDPCPIELGRDPELYAEIAERSGMRIVCTTGFYTEHGGTGLPFYWRARDPEEIAEHYVRELREGIDGTGIRPGAIKAATGVEVTAAERRVLTGAALAQQETGVAIITHTESSRHGDAQQEIFDAAGADLSRVLVGHQDEQEDVAPIRKLAERGTFVGIDRIGLELLAPDERRADHVATLVREGLTGHVCLSQDHICALTAPRVSIYVPPERRAARDSMQEAIDWQVWKRPYTYLVTDFVPRLLERGVAGADVETMLVDNPRRLLAGA